MTITFKRNATTSAYNMYTDYFEEPNITAVCVCVCVCVNVHYRRDSNVFAAYYIEIAYEQTFHFACFEAKTIERTDEKTKERKQQPKYRMR